jgi:hypothetical protein
LLFSKEISIPKFPISISSIIARNTVPCKEVNTSYHWHMIQQTGYQISSIFVVPETLTQNRAFQNMSQ